MQEVFFRITGRLLALMAGLVWGFFVAFNMVFSDVFGAEMFWAVLYVAVAYLVLGFMFGLMGRARAWRWGGWLGAPGFAMVALMVFDAPERWLYMASVVAALFAGSFAGAVLGSTMATLWVNHRQRRASAA